MLNRFFRLGFLRPCISRLIVICTALLIISSSTTGRADVIERVVAVVNGQALLLSELRRRAGPFLEQAMALSTVEERRAQVGAIYDQLLAQMVDEELIKQAAAEASIRVSAGDVERAIRNVRRANNLSEDEFWTAVRGQGYTEDQYRSEVQRQLLRLKLLNERVRSRVNVTDADVRRKYDEQARLMNANFRFRVSHVFIRVAEDANATIVAEGRQRAEGIRSELTAENFEAKTDEYGGGELGWLSEGDLPAALQEKLSTLSDGEIAAPVRGPNGFHILLLHERDTSTGDLPDYEEARPRIYQRLLETAMASQETVFLEELRRRATVRRHIGTDADPPAARTGEPVRPAE